MNGPRWVDLEVEGHKAECIKCTRWRSQWTCMYLEVEGHKAKCIKCTRWRSQGTW